MTLDDLDDEQKALVGELIILTVREIREQIVNDIEFTAKVWKKHGKIKSRRTKKAFEVCADLARGLNEVIPN